MLSRIYTKTGDDGTTALGDFSRAPKTDLRLAAYADVDEANSAIGVAVTTGGLANDVIALLIRIQNELFDVGADLCNPVTPDPAHQPLRIDESYITGSSRRATRTTSHSRRCAASCCLAERRAAPCCTSRGRSCGAPSGRLGGGQAHGDTVNLLAVKYLNRLSDLLFILSRVANEPDGDLLWKPGGER